MSAILSGSAHTWAAAHRVLLALVTLAIALAASVLIVVMTSAGSSRPSSVLAPGQGQIGTHNRGQSDNLNRTRTDLEKRCLQRMLTAC
jgi:hypothetical protein